MTATENSLRDLLRSTARDLEKATVEAASLKGKSSPKRKGTVALKQRAGHKDLLDALFERITPFYLADASGNLVITSKAFRALAPDIFAADLANPDPEETPAPLMAIMERLHAGEQDIRQSDTIATDGKERHFISSHFAIHGSKGQIVGFGGIYEDVSPLARATRKAGEMESWLQDVIRSSSDWVWSIDHNFNLSFVSPRISEAIGVPAQNLSGRHFFTLGHFDQTVKDRGTKYDMDLHRPFRNRMFLMESAAGETRRVLVNGVPVFDETSGRFQGYRGTGTDVTRRHNAEASAVDAKAELEKTLAELQHRNTDLAAALEKSQVADKAKIDFLAMMSHELRTPLNCIIGFSDAAAQKVHGPLNNSYIEYFQNIHKAGNHLLEIINDILDTANIEAQNVSIESIPVRVSELVTEAANMVDPKVGDAQRISMGGKDGIRDDILILTDRLRARQILVNLMSNAMKFTPEDGQVGVEVGLGENGLIDITVWDSGIGIPAEEQDRIFDRFYQVEKNILAREVEGTGLGLAISRQLAQLMDGDLTVESTVGEGTRFTLSLPQAQASK